MRRQTKEMAHVKVIDLEPTITLTKKKAQEVEHQ